MKSYAITDPKYYGDTTEILRDSLHNLFQTKKVDFLCFRDKESRIYEVMAEEFILTCKAHNFSKTLLHNDADLAYKLGAFGLHVSSSQFDLITQAKKYGLFCVASTHNEEEINIAVNLGVDAVTYSPVFHTPNKGIPKGLEDLKEKVDKISVKIIALGGIVSDEDVAKIKSTKAYAFASIRYFIK